MIYNKYLKTYPGPNVEVVGTLVLLLESTETPRVGPANLSVLSRRGSES